MEDNPHHLSSSSVHSTNCVDGIHINDNGTNGSSDGAAAAAAAAIVAANATSSVGHLGSSNNNAESIMIPFSSGGVGDLDGLRLSLNNGGLNPSSSNLNVCLGSNGNILVNAGDDINHLNMDGDVIDNIGQDGLGISADGTHIIHSSEISSNGIVDERALSSSLGDEQNRSDINSGISGNIVNSIASTIRRNAGPSSTAMGARGILPDVSIDAAEDISSNNFLTQGNVLDQGVLNHNDLTYPGPPIVLPRNSSRIDRPNSSVGRGMNASQQSLNSSMESDHHALVSNAAQNLIAVTATANIHHHATCSHAVCNNNSAVCSIAPSDMNVSPGAGTSSTIAINRSLPASTADARNAQNQSVWIQPDQSNNYAASSFHGDLNIRNQQRSSSSSSSSSLMLQRPTSSASTSSMGNQPVRGLRQSVHMNNDSFHTPVRDHFPGVFQLPGQDRHEAFQEAAHSTFGHSSPANEYREMGGDSEATPSYPNMHQEMSGEQVAEAINTTPTVDSSTLQQGYNLVFHADTRKFHVSRVISPSDCTVSQSTLGLEGSEAQPNTPLLPMASHSNQAYAMVHISSMPQFPQGGASEVSTSSMAAVLGVEDRSNQAGVSSLDSSQQNVMVLQKLENASLDGTTECDTTQGDIDFHQTRTPPYMTSSNSIDEEACLDSSSDLHTTVRGPRSGSGVDSRNIMDSTLDSSDPLTPVRASAAVEAAPAVGMGAGVSGTQLSQQDAVVPSTSGLQQEETASAAMAGPSGLFSGVTEAADENLPQSSGMGMYIRKSRRLELQEQEPKASQRKRDFSYKSQPYNVQLLWCDECMRAYETECNIHRTFPVADRVVLTRAWASAPGQVQIFKVPEHQQEAGESGFGVYAKRQIGKMTQFGPFEANLVDSIDQIASSFFPLVLEQEDGSKKFYETSDENACNWMIFVRSAKTFAEQNLVAYQYRDGIYFSVTKLIEAKQELKVWYAAHYAERIGLKPLELTEEDIQALDEEDAKFPCFECSRKFKSSAALQKHLEMVHESDDFLEMDGADEDYHARGEAGSGSTGSGKGRGKRKALFLRGKLVHGKNRNRDGDCSSYQWKKKSTNVYLSKTLKKYKKRQNSDKSANRSIYRRQGKDSGENEWVCTHCGLTFDKRSLLNLHTLTHAAEDLVAGESRMEASENGSDLAKPEGEGQPVEVMMACPKCSIIFTDQRELMNHVSSHAQRHAKRERPHECGECGKAFFTEEKLARHRLVHGKEEDKPLECQVCHKRLVNNSAMACHMKTHSERKYYDCPICHDDFDMGSALKEHGLKHADANGNFPCPSCPKVFDDFTMTRKHIKAFHSERSFECELCGKEFPRFDKLKLHKLKHTSHREFMCETCGRQFKRKDKLMEHMKRMHSKERLEQRLREKEIKEKEKEKEKKFTPKVMPTEYHRFIYKCHTCLLGFKRRGMLVNHLAKRHPDIKPEHVPELNLPILKTQKDFYCQYCDKIYKSSSKRKAHILKNHPGLQVPPSARKKLPQESPPAVTTLPGTSFSHTVGSITTVPHGCKFCHKQYASKAKLLQHQRKKHSELVEPAQSKRHWKSIRSDFLQIAVGDPASSLQERYESLPITVVTQADTLPNGDLLTQAMSEIQSYQNEYINPRLASNSAPTMVHIQPNLGQTIDLNHLNQALQNLTSQSGVATVLAPPHHTTSPASPGVSVVAQGGQQIHLSGGHFITRSWPTTFTTQFS